MKQFLYVQGEQKIPQHESYDIQKLCEYFDTEFCSFV